MEAISGKATFDLIAWRRGEDPGEGTNNFYSQHLITKPSALSL